MNQPVEILILSNDAENVRQWTQHLTGTNTRLWPTVAAVPADASIDLIVTDDNISESQFADRRLAARLAAGEIGVIGIGRQPSADVRLAEDVTGRELRLACQLLIETVRVKHELNRSRRMEATLKELAGTDPLTGLPNRRAWNERLLQSGVPADGSFTSLCVALLDLDHFKTINDRFGHLAGDRLLCHVAQRLASFADESSFVARLGGDEFALLFDGREPSTLAADCEHIRISACEDAPHFVTASVGLAVSSDPAEGIPPLQLLGSADAALRQAKTAGRNRTVVAEVEEPLVQ
jgi:diguanylate cyclase (GGDEF)-like protein